MSPEKRKEVKRLEARERVLSAQIKEVDRELAALETRKKKGKK